MRGQTILKRAIELITFLFAMFGGFLTNVAPPEEVNSRFAVGISSFLSLIVLLIISALVTRPLTRKLKRRWLIAASALFMLALGSALAYVWNINRLTFPYPPESIRAEYVGGTRLTPEAEEYRRANPTKTISNVVADFGGMESRELVWPPDSIRSAKLILLINYMLLVLGLSGSIFCLTEGLLS